MPHVRFRIVSGFSSNKHKTTILIRIIAHPFTKRSYDQGVLPLCFWALSGLQFVFRVGFRAGSALSQAGYDLLPVL